MGIFDFLKNSGREAKREDKLAEEITDMIRDGLRGQFTDPRVNVKDGVVTLYGTADSQETKEKAVLIAGNFKGVEKVNDDPVNVKQAAQQQPAGQFYTIQKGDTLSKIAQRHYNDANKWKALYEANRGVIDDPDKIYPGQQIRIPATV